MHFGENQLSRSLIGLSPLPTGHPPGFQPWWVRSSTRSYPRFNLPMGRSLRFGSTACDSDRPIQTRFRYGYPTRVNLATYRNSQAHSSKGTRSLHFSPKAENAPTACRHTVSGAISRPLTGALFTFPSRYLFPIAHHYSGNRGCFLFLWVLRCFTSPRYLHLPYVFRQGRWAITPNQVSPFGNPRIEVWLPTPRGLSQVPTSFIGSWCQGIHRVPLLTWQLQMMLASTVQFSRYGRSRSAHLRVRGGGEPVLIRDGLTPVPSGPNSVPGQAVAAATLPSRRTY